MHICFLSQEFPPDTGWGGIGTYLVEMTRALSAGGHQVTVISQGDQTWSVQASDSLRVVRLRPFGESLSEYRGLWRGAEALRRSRLDFNWAAARKLREVHRENPVDLVEAAEFDGNGFFVPVLEPRIPLVVRLHTARYFIHKIGGRPQRGNWKWVYGQERSSIRRADALSSPSRAMMEIATSWASPRGSKIQATIPNPISVGKPQSTSEIGMELLFVGRLEKLKGVRAIGEAIPILMTRSPSLRCRFLGGGLFHPEDGRSTESWLRDKVGSEHADRIVFETVSREEVLSRMTQARAVVLPSLWENFPYALLESMACGVPVVATDVGGIPEMVLDGETGLLVPPDNPEALAEAAIRLLEDKELSTRMGKAARQHVEANFTADKILPKMLDFYELVIQSATS